MKSPWCYGYMQSFTRVALRCVRFVQFLESRLSLDERKGLSVVLDRLVQTFLHDERYHNDLRYVTHCIKCVSSQSLISHQSTKMHDEYEINTLGSSSPGEFLQRSNRGVQSSSQSGCGDAGRGALYGLGPSV